MFLSFQLFHRVHYIIIIIIILTAHQVHTHSPTHTGLRAILVKNLFSKLAASARRMPAMA